MQDYLKRYFWVFGGLVVMVCAILGAKAANHYIEAKFLGESTKAKKTSRALPTKAKSDKKTSKKGEPLATRNMFCAECLPPEPDEDDVVDGDTVPLTKLPLQLVATNVSTKDEYSFATIRNTDTERQGAYWIGDVVPDAGPIEAIRGKHVDFRNNKRLERVSLLSKEPPKKKTTTSKKKSGKKDELGAKLDAGIKKISDNEYEIDRSLVDELLENPMAVAKGARIVPSVKNGKANGFKLYAIRPSSVYAKLGMKNGDTIHAVNGFDLTTPDKALEVYSKVKESNNLEINVTRRGKSVSIKYGIR
jgi:general secretion pathway protein C